MSTFDLIRVVNKGDADLTLRGNTVYTIPAGGDRIIPFTEACSWFGDPRLRDEGRHEMRSMAWRQIQNLWGYTEGMTYLVDRWDPTQGFKTWEDFAPSVECFDMDGNPVYFIIHDPEGTERFEGPKLVDPAFQDVNVLNERIAASEREMAELRSLLMERSATEAAPPAADTTSFDAVNLPVAPANDVVTHDGPAAVPAGRRDKK